jgi:hypothetical protein
MRVIAFVIVCMFSSVAFAQIEITHTLHTSKGESCTFKYNEPMPPMTIKELLDIVDARILNLEMDSMEWWDIFVRRICRLKTRKEKK